MATNAFVHARIDETLKNEAASVLAEMGSPYLTWFVLH